MRGARTAGGGGRAGEREGRGREMKTRRVVSGGRRDEKHVESNDDTEAALVVETVDEQKEE